MMCLTCLSWKMPPVRTSCAGTTSTGMYSPFSFSSRICTHISNLRVTSLHLRTRKSQTNPKSRKQITWCKTPQCTLLKVYISIIGQLQGVEAQVSAHLSRKVRVLAWMMLRSHSAGFLPGSACLCPYTSMATAPSVRYSIKSSVTLTACSYSTESITKVNALLIISW